MSEIYHIICANDEDAHKTLATIKTTAAEKFVAPSFHPNVPAYVVVIDPEDPAEVLALGELVSVEHRTPDEEETILDPMPDPTPEWTTEYLNDEQSEESGE